MVPADAPWLCVTQKPRRRALPAKSAVEADLLAREPDAALSRVAHVRKDMPSVEVAYVYVLDHVVDRWERRAAERPLYEELFGVGGTQGGDSAPEPAAGRQSIARPAELKPVAVEVVA
jgi:hypothetical protein